MGDKEHLQKEHVSHFFPFPDIPIV